MTEAVRLRIYDVLDQVYGGHDLGNVTKRWLQSLNGVHDFKSVINSLYLTLYFLIRCDHVHVPCRPLCYEKKVADSFADLAC